ncbi:aspartate kinase [Prosthecobacter dejongeii]|uniref:Aspartokinase n=1 Tax=Prosthecobacter dejongeii TaxID=48465 RepID=A0A7W8DQH4_9BACT|nr:aspartate kinase [Prosthecobacter dejongeii]MBB5038809.1 aspartate kinase [Prosthecobacter dejongeii]
MALIVQKYGGTSVGNPERIRNCARRILETQRAGHQVVAVVSAMSGVTDNLIRLAKEVSPEQDPSEREMDVLLSTGEQTTIALTAMAINALGGKAVSLTGAQAGISTDRMHTKARIVNITPDAVHKMLDEGNIVMLAGFQGETASGEITTLGRGGSDLTAIAMAAAIKADLCQIYTDVDGVYTCDPRVVKCATKIEEISYDEMLEMASSGSKVMQSRSVEFAKKFGVRFEVRSSLNNNPGTLVKEETPGMESVVVRGVSLERNQAKITIDDVPDRPGISSVIFGAIAGANIMIDMIVQNVSFDGETDISFTLSAADLPKAEKALRDILSTLGDKVTLRTESGVAKLSVVGIGMRSHSGVAAKMFKALADVSVNILMISTSEIKTAVIVQEADIETASRAVHTAFGLDAA